jgi:flavodoxin
MAEEYEIRIEGHLDAHWADWFAGLALTHLEGDETLLSGPLPDQVALHGLLERVRDLNLTLVSVTRGRPSSPAAAEEGQGGPPMKAIVVSYSLTGNNQDVAERLAQRLAAEHVRISEPKARRSGRIVTDIMFKRTPRIDMPALDAAAYDLLLFVGPVWMGQVATPFRACFQRLAPALGDYAFVSVDGGADGPNPGLAGELEERLGKPPLCVIELPLAELLPAEPAPKRRDTMAYRISQDEAAHLAERAAAALLEAVA